MCTLRRACLRRRRSLEYQLGPTKPISHLQKSKQRRTGIRSGQIAYCERLIIKTIKTYREYIYRTSIPSDLTSSQAITTTLYPSIHACTAFTEAPAPQHASPQHQASPLCRIPSSTHSPDPGYSAATFLRLAGIRDWFLICPTPFEQVTQSLFVRLLAFH